MLVEGRSANVKGEKELGQGKHDQASSILTAYTQRQDIE